MDAFALLGLPRRPWLDPADVRTAFQERARARHPDAASGDEAAFAALNAAQGQLADPAARLRLLLGGDAAVPAAPPDADFGFRLGGHLRAVDDALGRARAAVNPITRALLRGELAALRAATADLEADLAGRRRAAEDRLRALDAAFASAPPGPELAALAAEFLYLQRWQSQLRARALELEIAALP